MLLACGNRAGGVQPSTLRRRLSSRPRLRMDARRDSSKNGWSSDGAGGSSPARAAGRTALPGEEASRIDFILFALKKRIASPVEGKDIHTVRARQGLKIVRSKQARCKNLAVSGTGGQAS
jgi:hypothetical protein